MKYFEKLPISEYRFGHGDWFLFRDIFVRLRLLDGLQDNPSFLTSVVLNSSERADVLAHRLYGNSNLFWTLYLVNDIVDPADWIKTDRQMEVFVREKYENPDETSHLVDSEGKAGDPRANKIMVEKKPFGTENISPESFFPISHYQREENLNDSRRIVRAIRKEYMAGFLADVDEKLRGFQNV